MFLLGMNTGPNEPGTEVYRKLTYFLESGQPVHFSLVRGGWKNGYVRDLNPSSLIVVLNELKEGVLVLTCEEIIPASIELYREKPIEEALDA